MPRMPPPWLLPWPAFRARGGLRPQEGWGVTWLRHLCRHIGRMKVVSAGNGPVICHLMPSRCACVRARVGVWVRVCVVRRLDKCAICMCTCTCTCICICSHVCTCVYACMYIRTTTCVNGVARRRHDRQRSIQYQCRKSGQIPTSTKETRVYFVFCVFLFSVFPVITPKTLNPPTHTHTHTHTPISRRRGHASRRQAGGRERGPRVAH